MLKINKKAIVLVYVIFLVNIAVIMAMVIVNNSYVFFNNLEEQNIKESMNKDIYDKSVSVFKVSTFYNSNGSGFTDNISCPNATSPIKYITISGTATGATTSTGVSFLDYGTGNISCSGTYLFNGKNFKIWFNKDYTGFSGATYSGSYTDLVAGSGLTAFANSSGTTILFNSTGLGGRDNIDDNFNSDNYSVNSTGTTATGVYYPNNFADDDVEHRKKIVGYVTPNTINYNIFFNNKETNQVISGSLNNGDSLNSKISQVSNGYMTLNVDGIYSLKVVKFSKTKYDTNKELYPVETIKGTDISNTYGYIQNNGGVLSTYDKKTGNEYVFDFTSYYYGIFLTNNTNNVLTYSLKAETQTGTGVYIVPIDDNSTELKFLGNDVLDDFGKYSFVQFYLSSKK